MSDFLKESYPTLFKILRNWPSEPARPPLLINGLGSDGSKEIWDGIIGIFFKKPLHSGDPDLLILEKDSQKSNIDVDKTREFIGQLALTHFEYPYKLGIVPAAHLLNPSSQNALLKTLEEPLPNRYLIMGTTAKNLLLPTILSRSTIINLPKPALEPDRVLSEQYRQWIALDPARRLKAGERWSEAQPEKIKQFFDFIVNSLHEKMLQNISRKKIKKVRSTTGQMARALNYAEQLQRTSGASPKLLFESFLLNSD